MNNPIPQKVLDKLLKNKIGVVRVADGYLLSLTKEFLRETLEELEKNNRDRAIIQVIHEESAQ